MRHNQALPVTPNAGIHVWKHGKRTMPKWLREHMAGRIASNGTFTLNTELGKARVNAGDVVIEQRGSIWVRTTEEAPDFLRSLDRASAPHITNIGPGKARQFGVTGSQRRAGTRNAKSLERPARCAPVVGALPTIEWVHVERLSVDSGYQRSTDNDASRRLIIGIAANFDWRLCGPLVVSRRPDDMLVIIDGQHRLLAAKRRGDIPQLPCCIFRYESTEEEARMFILANRSRKPMNRLDDYYAAVAAADEDALEIQQVVTDAGLRVARCTSVMGWRPGEIAFTSSIAVALRKVGPALTSAALANMATAFPGQKLGHGGGIFNALIKIMSRPEPDFDPDRLVSVLQSRTAESWGLCATGLRGGDVRAIALQKVIMDAYRRKSAQG